MTGAADDRVAVPGKNVLELTRRVCSGNVNSR